MSQSDDIKVGDIITAYHKGYHRVVDIYDTTNYALIKIPQIKYKQVLNSQFTNKGNGITRSCHSGYCKKVTTESITKWAEEQAAFYLEGAKEVIKLL